MLIPGPYGLYGAAEGVSYLVVLGIIGWSLSTKVRPAASFIAIPSLACCRWLRESPAMTPSRAAQVRTGSGLPAGPSGLLGAVEGLSYLTLVASIAAFTLTFLEKGSLPGVTG